MPLNSTDFFKGLSGYTRGSDELRSDDIETGIYFRWWRLMRLSPVFWYANKSKLPIEDADALNAYELAGDLNQRKFETWWKETGRKVFSEPQRPRSVRAIDLEQPPEIDLYERSVVVEIPLTVSKQKIFRELRKIVNSRLTNEDDSSRRFNVAAYSKAALKIHTKKFNITAIDHEYYALVYRILYPNAKLWLLADRLRLSRNNEIRSAEGVLSKEELADRRLRLQALIGRYLYKVEYARHNLIGKTFPNYTKVDYETFQPFGTDRDVNYKSMTKEGKFSSPTEMSEWQKWVEKEHGSALRAYICKVNGITRKDAMSVQDFNKRLDLFMSSLIDFEPKVASTGQATQRLKKNSMD